MQHRGRSVMVLYLFYIVVEDGCFNLLIFSGDMCVRLRNKFGVLMICTIVTGLNSINQRSNSYSKAIFSLIKSMECFYWIIMVYWYAKNSCGVKQLLLWIGLGYWFRLLMNLRVIVRQVDVIRASLWAFGIIWSDRKELHCTCLC